MYEEEWWGDFKGQERSIRLGMFGNVAAVLAGALTALLRRPWVTTYSGVGEGSGLDDEQVRGAIAAATAAESNGVFGPQEWTDLAAQMLALGRNDQWVVDLAILKSPVSGWSTDPVVSILHQRLKLQVLDVESATSMFARALADDLRERPANITTPMIRMIARTAPPDYGSKLAMDCFGLEEYLDCNCHAEVDPTYELELEAPPTLGLPDAVVEVLARRARQTLPSTQPAHGH